MNRNENKNNPGNILKHLPPQSRLQIIKVKVIYPIVSALNGFFYCWSRETRRLLTSSGATALYRK